MRLFYALVPDEALRASLGARALALADAIGGRAVPAHNVHMTLAFLGEVPGERVGALRDISGALPRAAFTLVLDRVGEWHHAGVAWIAPSRVPAELAALQAALADSLRAREFALEARPFRPHLTLVRRRRKPLVDAPTEPLVWNVSRVSLMRSESTAGLVRYREHAGMALT